MDTVLGHYAPKLANASIEWFDENKLRKENSTLRIQLSTMRDLNKTIEQIPSSISEEEWKNRVRKEASGL